jgi:putative spermidine/putrescine transport system ATP-binding protein
VLREVADIFDLLGLSCVAQTKVGEITYGQQRLLEVALALALRPKVLLLDEPLGALDQKLRREMQLELKRLQRTLGITFVFVTHDQEEALTMSDRIAVMNRGKVEQLDTAEQVFERPRTRFVAEFMGAANFMGDDAGRRFVVRPEKLRLSKAPIAGLSCVEVTVDERSYQGLSTVWTLLTAEGLKLTAYEQNVGSADAPRLAAGSRAFACWHANHAVVLDSSEGGAG